MARVGPPWRAFALADAVHDALYRHRPDRSRANRSSACRRRELVLFAVRLIVQTITLKPVVVISCAS